MKRIIWIVIDIAAAALILFGVWGFNYLIPQKGIRAVPIQSSFTKNTENQDTLMEKMEEQTDVQMEDTGGQNDFLQRTNITMDTQDWHKKFVDQFTDQVVSTDTSYTSPNVSVQLSYHQYDTGKLDSSNSGKHEKYGTKISYVLADIYVGDITCFQTAFAKDTYGVGYSEKLTDMSARMKSIQQVSSKQRQRTGNF